MSLFNSYDRTQFLGETNFPLDTQGGVLTPAQQKAAILANLGIGTSGSLTLSNLTAGNIVGSTSILMEGANGLGFGVGAGGSATQLTSRTTGVTINRSAGSITLFSAAGSATPATFTVSTNRVSAADTIILSQKSGADKYELNVTNITAGASFDITYFTTGGTTTETPVFNFAIIKGSTT